ncbi:Metallo-peptidase family M12-domain-containing protein [Phascolomyces articulosus]|uniref:Disintegrin and metalloproteinase domain-containing protein B n=1 Tax=Phascolomyces articulosus TaxID=60185 RepID=A0AAD5PJK2_9FUNG|nr:Metallo-peptidase family M12-domain-containing protein [Phascolomyces articulosus]
MNIVLLLFSLFLLHLVTGHSVNNRQLLHVEPLRTVQLDIAPRPEKFFRKRSLTQNPAYTPNSHSIEHDDILRLTLSAYNQTINLHLHPNLNLFHPNAVTWRNGQGTPLTHDQFRIYRGYVVSNSDTHHRWKRDRAGVIPDDTMDFMNDGQQLGWARVILRQDLTKPGMEYPVFEGTFTMNGEMYHIKTTSNYKLSKRQDDAELTNGDNAHMVIYRDSDTTLVLPQDNDDHHNGDGECGFDRLAFHKDNQFQHPVLRVGHPAAGEMGIYTPSHLFDSPFTGGSSGLTKRQSSSGCPSSTLINYMGVAADCTYTRHYGSIEDARTQIINNWNTASGVYESTFNIQLGIINITILPETCPSTPEPDWNRDCSNSYTISERLSDFSLWRSYMSDDGAGLWHLMTNCATGVEVGVAWLQQLCNMGVNQQSVGGQTQYVSGTGVSSVLRDEWKVVAHEIGHGFGAIHDCTSDSCPCSGSSCQCCPLSDTQCDAGGTYIMNPTNNVSTESFSPCSINTICGLFSSMGTCLEAPGSRTVQTLQMCGNGIKEEGEDCDPGGQPSSCCDATTCKFVNGATCDDTTDLCCDNCQLRPANTVCREAQSECDIAEHCDGTTGDCPADTYVDDGTSCGNGSSLQCASGQCTSRDQQCRERGSELSITSACSAMGSSCQITCSSSSGTGCTIFNGNFLDGTPCGSGGRCRDGSCDYGSTNNKALAWLQDNKEIAIPVGVVLALILLFILIRCFLRGCCCWPGLTAYKTRRRALQHSQVAPPPAGYYNNSTPDHSSRPPSSIPPPPPPVRSSGGWVDPTAYNGPTSNTATPPYPPPTYYPPPSTPPHSRSPPPPPPAHNVSPTSRAQRFSGY